MTVTELISRLARFPPHAQVLCQWWEGQGDVFTPEVIREATDQEKNNCLQIHSDRHDPAVYITRRT